METLDHLLQGGDVVDIIKIHVQGAARPPPGRMASVKRPNDRTTTPWFPRDLVTARARTPTPGRVDRDRPKKDPKRHLEQGHTMSYSNMKEFS